MNDCCLFFYIFFRKLSKDILWLTPPTHLISWLHFPPLDSFPLLFFFPLLGPFSSLSLSCCDYFERKPSHTSTPPTPLSHHTLLKLFRGLFFSYFPFSIKKKTGEKLFIWGLGVVPHPVWFLSCVFLKQPQVFMCVSFFPFFPLSFPSFFLSLPFLSLFLILPSSFFP